MSQCRVARRSSTKRERAVRGLAIVRASRLKDLRVFEWAQLGLEAQESEYSIDGDARATRFGGVRPLEHIEWS